MQPRRATCDSRLLAIGVAAAKIWPFVYPLGPRLVLLAIRHYVGARGRSLGPVRQGDDALASVQGRYLFLALLYAVWVTASIAAWIVLGRHPRWSEQRFAMCRWATVTPRAWDERGAPR
jgi:hypothetical protein